MEGSKELTCHWCSCYTFWRLWTRRMEKELTSSLDDCASQYIDGLVCFRSFPTVARSGLRRRRRSRPSSSHFCVHDVVVEVQDGEFIARSAAVEALMPCCGVAAQIVGVASPAAVVVSGGCCGPRCWAGAAAAAWGRVVPAAKECGAA